MPIGRIQNDIQSHLSATFKEVEDKPTTAIIVYNKEVYKAALKISLQASLSQHHLYQKADTLHHLCVAKKTKFADSQVVNLEEEPELIIFLWLFREGFLTDQNISNKETDKDNTLL